MSKCKECLSEQVCRYNDGINLCCKEDYECKNFKNKADFVEVVRCKDCKHYGDAGDCEVHPYDGRIGVNYFCEDGERKEK